MSALPAGGGASLVLAGHGSRDPRFLATLEAAAAEVRDRAPGLEVRVGLLDHGPPAVTDVVEPGCVVVPMLLAGGYHVRFDLPAQAPGATLTAPLGPDPLLAVALADRLGEAGYDGGAPVTLAAAGSGDSAAVADVHRAAGHLAERLGVQVRAAFVTAAEPRLAAVRPREGPWVVASYLLAPGVFAEQVAGCGADVVSAPIGAHPAVAEIVLGRYAAHTPGRTAPA
jgi:sirohydrochlorin ferrochelatase